MRENSTSSQDPRDRKNRLVTFRAEQARETRVVLMFFRVQGKCHARSILRTFASGSNITQVMTQSTFYSRNLLLCFQVSVFFVSYSF